MLVEMQKEKLQKQLADAKAALTKLKSEQEEAEREYQSRMLQAAKDTAEQLRAEQRGAGRHRVDEQRGDAEGAAYQRVRAREAPQHVERPDGPTRSGGAARRRLLLGSDVSDRLRRAAWLP